jgi:hypothetical protein
MLRAVLLRRWSAIICAALCLGPAASLHAKKRELPRLPDSTLLIGWPPFYLALTAGDQTLQVQRDPHSDWYVTPSLSADGSIVASVHPSPGEPTQSRNLVVSLWSRSDQHWTDIPQFTIDGGSVAVSPDGTRLAAVTRYTLNGPSRLKVLDRTTGKIVEGPEVYERAATDITWAPDSRRLAFDIGSNGAPVKANPSPLRAIYIMDTGSGTIRRIARGVAPSWSPSGGWIAYLDYFPDNDDAGPGFAAPQPNRVSLMRPDGSDTRVLLTLPRDQALMIPPVWSPGSHSILINRWHDRDKATMDIDRLDIDTGKITHSFRNVPPIYAWLKSK